MDDTECGLKEYLKVQETEAWNSVSNVENKDTSLWISQVYVIILDSINVALGVSKRLIKLGLVCGFLLNFWAIYTSPAGKWTLYLAFYVCEGYFIWSLSQVLHEYALRHYQGSKFMRALERYFYRGWSFEHLCGPALGFSNEEYAYLMKVYLHLTVAMILVSIGGFIHLHFHLKGALMMFGFAFLLTAAIHLTIERKEWIKYWIFFMLEAFYGGAVLGGLLGHYMGYDDRFFATMSVGVAICIAFFALGAKHKGGRLYSSSLFVSFYLLLVWFFAAYSSFGCQTHAWSLENIAKVLYATMLLLIYLAVYSQDILHVASEDGLLDPTSPRDRSFVWQHVLTFFAGFCGICFHLAIVLLKETRKLLEVPEEGN